MIHVTSVVSGRSELAEIEIAIGIAIGIAMKLTAKLTRKAS